MPRAPNGQAIGPRRRTPAARRRLAKFLTEAKASDDLSAWRRAKAVLGYIEGQTVLYLSGVLDITRGSINRWLQWYEADGIEGLCSKKAAGRTPRLTQEQRDELAAIIEAGPQAAGYSSGMWTGPMLGDWVRSHFNVVYHNQHIPRLLHQMGFSVQRPRKRLARADAEAQAHWIRVRFPAIKKKPSPAGA
jgi:transposase